MREGCYGGNSGNTNLKTRLLVIPNDTTGVGTRRLGSDDDGTITSRLFMTRSRQHNAGRLTTARRQAHSARWHDDAAQRRYDDSREDDGETTAQRWHDDARPGRQHEANGHRREKPAHGYQMKTKGFWFCCRCSGHLVPFDACKVAIADVFWQHQTPRPRGTTTSRRHGPMDDGPQTTSDQFSLLVTKRTARAHESTTA